MVVAGAVEGLLLLPHVHGAMADPAWVATEQHLLHQTGSVLGCNRVGSSPGGVSCLPLLPFLNA